MSVVDTVVRLARRVASRAARAIVHPVETATDAADLAGSAATAAAAAVAAVAAVAGTKEPDTGGTDRSTAPKPGSATAPPVEPPEALLFPPGPAPAAPPVATEPKPADVDDWQDELDDASDEVPAPAEPDDDRPLLDPSVAKAVQHESQMMRRAAERDPEGASGAY